MAYTANCVLDTVRLEAPQDHVVSDTLADAFVHVGSCGPMLENVNPELPLLGLNIHPPPRSFFPDGQLATQFMS